MMRKSIRFEEIEIRRVEKGVEVRVKASGDPRQKTAVGEGHRLHSSDIDAEGGRGEFVVLDALPEEPVLGEDQILRNEDEEDQDEEDQFEVRYPRYSHESPRSAQHVGDPVRVVEEDPDENTEAEGGDGKEIVPEPQDGKTDQIADERREKAAGEGARAERGGADSTERAWVRYAEVYAPIPVKRPAWAEGELARIAIDHVESQGGKDYHEGEKEDLLDILDTNPERKSPFRTR